MENPWKMVVSYGFMGDSIGDFMGISLTNLTLVDINLCWLMLVDVNLMGISWDILEKICG